MSTSKHPAQRVQDTAEDDSRLGRVKRLSKTRSINIKPGGRRDRKTDMSSARYREKDLVCRKRRKEGVWKSGRGGEGGDGCKSVGLYEITNVGGLHMYVRQLELPRRQGWEHSAKPYRACLGRMGQLCVDIHGARWPNWQGLADLGLLGVGVRCCSVRGQGATHCSPLQKAQQRCGSIPST